jgi:poly(3-hydroxybutyrate) depolymerase
MLYQLYETQRALLAPFAEFASASSKLYSHPLSPFTHTPMAQRVSAGFDLVHRLAKDYEKPEFNITQAHVQGVPVAVQQQVAIEKPFCRLLRFKRFTDNPQALGTMKGQPTVLVVAPLSGHHSTLLRDTVTSRCRTTRCSSPTGPTRAWCRPTRGPSTSTTMSPMCRSSSATSGLT